MAVKYSSFTWKCTGTKESPHPEVINSGSQCKLCGKPSPDIVPSSKQGVSKGVIASLLTAVTLLASVAGYGIYQVFKPCLPDFYRQGDTCVPKKQHPLNLFRNPDTAK